MAAANLSALCRTLSEGAAQSNCLRRSSGDDPFAVQKMYEKWVKQDQWLVRAQAIPLLFGVEPELWPRALADPGLREAEQGLWRELREAIRSGALPAVAADNGDWKVANNTWYRWASAQAISVPEPFDALMQFVILAVGTGLPLEPEPGPATRHAACGEQVLGAALNMVTKCAEKCIDDDGFFSGELIAKLIIGQSVRWFDTPEPPISHQEMASLIDKWLE